MAYDFKDLEKGLTNVKDRLLQEFSNIRTGRASISLIESVRVESYGSLMPLNQVASLSMDDARTIRVSPWDTSIIGAIDRAIVRSELGVSASVSEGVVRVHFPEMTGETRERVAKVAKEKHEEARISLKSERNKAITELEASKKSGELSEDELAAAKTKLQTRIDAFNKELDELLEKKREEILG